MTMTIALFINFLLSLGSITSAAHYHHMTEGQQTELQSTHNIIIDDTHAF